MNRLWYHHFGRGLAATPGNLGRAGSPPTHPELLDWLASEFVRTGWKSKPMHRLIVTSTTYRQSAHPKPGTSPDPAVLDPDNLLLGRARLRRLESEAILDSILSVSGQLDRRIGGPFIPLEGRPDGTVTIARNAANPAGLQRRSLYLYARRNFNLSLLAAFDQPLIGTNCTARQTSVVVPQALAVLNDPILVAAAEKFAQRVYAVAASPQERITVAFRLALGRPPDVDETTAAQALLERHAQRYADLPVDQAALRSLGHLCHMLLCSNEFLYVE